MFFLSVSSKFSSNYTSHDKLHKPSSHDCDHNCCLYPDSNRWAVYFLSQLFSKALGQLIVTLDWVQFSIKDGVLFFANYMLHYVNLTS